MTRKIEPRPSQDGGHVDVNIVETADVIGSSSHVSTQPDVVMAVTSQPVIGTSMTCHSVIGTSVTSQRPKWRRCPRCSRRMSSFDSDPHSLCFYCRGRECNHTERCSECQSWDGELMDVYVKHQRVLQRKRRYSAKSRERRVTSGGIHR